MTDEELAFNREIWEHNRAQERMTFKQFSFDVKAPNESELMERAFERLAEATDHPMNWTLVNLTMESFQPEPGVDMIHGQFQFMCEMGDVPWK